MRWQHRPAASTPHVSRPGGTTRDPIIPRVKVTNGSDLPIYDVCVVLTLKYEGEDVEWLARYGSIRGDLLVAEILPLQTEEPCVRDGHAFAIKSGWIDVSGSPDDHHVYTFPNHVRPAGWTACLHFRDASGLTWKRDPNGILSRSPDLTGADNTGP